MRIIPFIFVLILSSCSANLDVSTKKSATISQAELEKYPAITETMIRHVIALPKTNNDANRQVEFWVTTQKEVDCNSHRLLGQLVKKNLKGWGYNYYQFTGDGKTSSTMMACPNNEKKLKAVNSNSVKVNYNSKLPLVIYTPKGVEVAYQIWFKHEKITVAEQQ